MRAARWLPIAVVVAFAGLVAEASAQTASDTYTCRDRNGHTITSDRPIPDCASVMRELGPSGVVKREIAPPMSAEQIRQKEADDQAKRTADEAARERRRRDAALLAAYQSEDQIEAARNRALADTNDAIRTSQERLVELQKDKKELEQEKQTFKGPPSPVFKRRVDDNQMLIADEESAVRQRRADLDRINQRYDDDRRRFRELAARR